MTVNYIIVELFNKKHFLPPILCWIISLFLLKVALVIQKKKNKLIEMLCLAQQILWVNKMLAIPLQHLCCYENS